LSDDASFEKVFWKASGDFWEMLPKSCWRNVVDFD
jgi:hypothetical protein